MVVYYDQHAPYPLIPEKRSRNGGRCFSTTIKSVLLMPVARWSRVNMESLSSEDPMGYCVFRLDHWPELTQYTLELLTFHAASVLAQRAFSVAGDFDMER